jgi:O-acetyl-ADP-ribose deacetylase (regulator of RNase III)
VRRPRPIALAAEQGVRRVALPAISTGVYGYLLEVAAEVALAATTAGLDVQTRGLGGALLAARRDAYAAFAAASASL